MYYQKPGKNLPKTSCNPFFINIEKFKQGCHFTWKNLEFDNLDKKNLEFETF